MRVTWWVVGFVLTACGGRTGLEVPGDACLADSADCDGDPSNGCEADLTTNAAHCGACGESCHDGLFCAAGGCVPGNRVVEVESRVLTQLARTADGRVFAWGFNGSGMVDPSSDDEVIFTPRQIQLPFLAAEVKVAWRTACAREFDGAVWCWPGRDESFTRVEGLAAVTKLMSDQSGFCTFDAYRGQTCWQTDLAGGLPVVLGNADLRIASDVPYEIVDLPRPLAFLTSSAAAVKGGELLTWGSAAWTGRNVDAGDLHVPIAQVDGIKDVVRIDSGDDKFCATERDARIVCWGDVFSTGTVQAAHARFTEGPYKRAAVGADVCALKINGDLDCIGFDDVRRPIQHGVADVSAASSHSCIVGMEGRVACVGGNSLGGLGTDPDELQSARDFVEVRIPGLD